MPRHRLGVAVSCIAAAASLSACGSDDGDYPPGWPPVAVSWFQSCPDLAGTYDVTPGLIPRLPVSQLEGGPAGPRWERLVIDGSPGHVLRLTLTRTITPEAGVPIDLLHGEERAAAERAAALNAEYGRPKVGPAAESQATLKPGEYTCSHGRLWVRGGITLARDTAHGLVADDAQAVVTRQVDVWCGDHCVGIPTGLGRKHHWARWDRT